MRMKQAGLILAALAILLGALWAVPASAQRQGPNHDHGQQRQPATQFHGDPAVHNGLVAATAAATRQRPRQVRQQLKVGKSIEQIAQAAGSSAADVLARFDQGIDRAMQRAVTNERLPQSVADSRAAWFKQSARLQIDQPGLEPAFPGLHEVHVMMISAAVRQSGIPRATIRAELGTCKNLTTIVGTRGKTGTDVANDAIAQADKLFDVWVAAGQLTTAQRDEWRAAFGKTANNMVSTPGLHVAGKECAQ
ncbi:MAG TPA: hypothetical protein VGD58_14880 [Herpetosiphonaceae bacterium]